MTEITGPLLHSVSTTSSDFPNPFLESHEKELSRLFTRTPNRPFSQVSHLGIETRLITQKTQDGGVALLCSAMCQ